MTSLIALDATKTLRPGILVSLNTHVAGNASYKREVIEAETIDANGTLTEKFVTDKKILDAAEQEAACQTRDKARRIVATVCAKTAFGYLCPEANEAELRTAIREAQSVVDKFNETAKVTRVAFFPLTGRVAADDEEAVKRINKEVRSLVSVMEEGVRNLDVKKIREAAEEARQLGQMLNPDAQARITVAIEAARATARAVQKAAKAGETAAQEIDNRALRALTEVRTAFLDLDTPEREIAKPFTEGRAVDFEPEGERAKAASTAGSAREIEV